MAMAPHRLSRTATAHLPMRSRRRGYQPDWEIAADSGTMPPALPSLPDPLASSHWLSAPRSPQDRARIRCQPPRLPLSPVDPLCPVASTALERSAHPSVSVTAKPVPPRPLPLTTPAQRNRRNSWQTGADPWTPARPDRPEPELSLSRLTPGSPQSLDPWHPGWRSERTTPQAQLQTTSLQRPAVAPDPWQPSGQPFAIAPQPRTVAALPLHDPWQPAAITLGTPRQPQQANSVAIAPRPAIATALPDPLLLPGGTGQASVPTRSPLAAAIATPMIGTPIDPLLPTQPSRLIELRPFRLMRAIARWVPQWWERRSA